MQNRLHSHYESLSRAIRFTRMADTKAAAVLALQFVLLGALAAQSAELLAVITECCGSFKEVALTVVTALYGLSTIAAIGLAVWVYIPSTPKGGKSLIYFEDVANMNYADFETAALQLQSPDIERQLLAQIHQVSRIASNKMRRVRWAFYASGCSIFLGITLLAWATML